MSEKIYAWLLWLYPSHFREAYRDEALQLFRDRARDERGFFLTLRLWLDLLADLVVSVSRGYRYVRPELISVSARQNMGGMPSFHVLGGESPRLGALLFGGALSLAAVGGFSIASRYVDTHPQVRGPIAYSQPSRPEPRAVNDARGTTIQPLQPPANATAVTPVTVKPDDFRLAQPLIAVFEIDSSPHRAQFVTVDRNVKLEVLDWGGSGRPLILLAGLGSTAHVFDGFAPRLTAKHHVYGITRRGFGASSQPAPAVSNYSATRLGDDVLAVMDALQLNRPVLVGHSLAGEELSSVGSRYSEKIAGLVYLEAGYAFAYYDRAHGDLWLDMVDVRKRIDEMESGAGDRKQLWRDILSDVSRLQKLLQEMNRQIASMPAMRTPPPIERAIQFGWEKHTEIHVPILAIFALPKIPDARIMNQVNAFEAGLPSARVVRLKNAGHFIFNSNEADVLREMNAFLATLR